MNKKRVAVIGAGKVSEAEIMRILDRDDIEIIDIENVRPEDMQIYKISAPPLLPPMEIPFHPPLTRAEKRKHKDKLIREISSK